MKQSKIIGLTGSIATGKSAATEIIKSLGYPVIDADIVAKEIETDEKIIKKIGEVFGENIIKDGKMDRIALGKIVFADKSEMEKLNNIVHPAVFKRMRKKIEELDDEVIFLDIPLLIETRDIMKKYGLDFDEIWLVYLPIDIQIKRLMARDNISREYAEIKINSQISAEDKKKYADIILDNSGTLEDLKNLIKDHLI